jgi:hypothetical protein
VVKLSRSSLVNDVDDTLVILTFSPIVSTDGATSARWRRRRPRDRRTPVELLPPLRIRGRRNSPTSEPITRPPQLVNVTPALEQLASVMVISCIAQQLHGLNI